MNDMALAETQRREVREEKEKKEENPPSAGVH